MTDDKKPAEFLEDEAQEGIKYIQPNIETKLSVHKRKECRNIVQEIKTFGINQRQLLYLIYLLSLELENREVMVALTKAVGENREKIQSSKLILGNENED